MIRVFSEETWGVQDEVVLQLLPLKLSLNLIASTVIRSQLCPSNTMHDVVSSDSNANAEYK